MANWDELKSYIHTNYKATEVSPRALEMLFTLPNGRSQVVYVSSVEGPDGAHWASIDSAIGSEDSLNVLQALRMVEDSVCGGLAHLQVRGVDLISVRHVVPLENLDVPEFVQPLQCVTLVADEIERQLTGIDLR